MQNTKTVLEDAAKGLLMMSEADYAFEYFTTDAAIIDDKLALKLAGKPEGTTVETTTIDYLLRNMTDSSIGSVSADDAQKFQKLALTLNQQLKDIKVYRVGRVQIQVFIIGKTADGTLAGMKTLLIET